MKILKFHLFFSLLVIPIFAFANAGSPMLWFSIFHLLFINFIIGIIESSILTRFGLLNKSSIIILGNYISMLVGIVLLSSPVAYIITDNNFWETYDIKSFLIGMSVAFFVTLIIEYPFFRWALMKSNRHEGFFTKFVAANVITYIGMTLIYLLFIILS